MYNRVILVGNLTRDIEMRYATSGTAIGSTGIAVTRKTTINGEKRDETCFIDITFWGRTAEVASQYLSKGSKILIDGRLKYEQWQDSTGQNRSKHTVSVETMEMLGANPNSGAYNQGGYNAQGYQGGSQGSAYQGAKSGDPYAENAPKQAQKPAPHQEKLKETDIDNFENDDSELPF